jgi:predicted metal-dependent RNase
MARKNVEVENEVEQENRMDEMVSTGKSEVAKLFGIRSGTKVEEICKMLYSNRNRIVSMDEIGSKIYSENTATETEVKVSALLRSVEYRIVMERLPFALLRGNSSRVKNGVGLFDD